MKNEKWEMGNGKWEMGNGIKMKKICQGRCPWL